MGLLIYDHNQEAFTHNNWCVINNNGTHTPSSGKVYDDGAWKQAWIGYTPPSWASATDAELVEALYLHHAGIIDLRNYWSVGDERVVHLSEITKPSSDVTPQSLNIAEQDVTFVLLNKGGVDLVDGNECAFIVGQKDPLVYYSNAIPYRYNMFVDNRTTTKLAWNQTKLYSWFNGGAYYNALPSDFKSIIKQAKYQCLTSGSTKTSKTYYYTSAYITLPSAYEILGTSSNFYGDEGVYLEYYQTANNRKKYVNGFSNDYWTRAMYIGSSYYFFAWNSTMNRMDGRNYDQNSVALAPQFCI